MAETRVDAATISIVVPARDEAERIGLVLGQFDPGHGHELIVADGESEDETAAIARDAGARVVSTPPGRGQQMNAGAAAATGDLLLFLHADTGLPVNFADHVRDILARPGVVAGAFLLRIDADGPGFRIVEAAANWRSRFRHLPYGDQGIFLRRQTFARVDGFRPLPIMEDYELMRRLRRLGRVVIAPAAARTSARMWLRAGVARATMVNQLCIAAFHAGVAPERIAAWRRSVGGGSAVSRRSSSGPGSP